MNVKGFFKSIWFLIIKLSIVHPSFVHGKNLKMGYFNVIEAGVTVGADVDIQHHTLLKKFTIIGNGCYVDSYFRSSGDNNIGNDVTLRFGSTIARKVVIGDGVFISPNVMTVYSLPDGTKSKGTVIDDDAFIGTAAIVGPNIRIGKKAVVGTNSFVNKDCKGGSVYAGVPARHIRKL